MIPPELLGMRPFHQSSSGTELSDFLANRAREQDQQELGLRQLAEQQQHNRAIESNAAGELDREKNKDALLAKAASAKLDKKLSSEDTKLWNQYNVRAIQAEAVGDIASAKAYRNAMDALTSGAAPLDAGPEMGATPHVGGAEPAPGSPPQAQESRPFVDMGGLQFASKGPSGAFRTSTPGAPPPPEAAPEASPVPSPQAAPSGAFGSGFDTSKVGAVSPDEVDSSAIAASMLGMPVRGKKHGKGKGSGKNVIELPDQEITAADPNVTELLGNPRGQADYNDVGAPPEGPAGLGMGASATPAEGGKKGHWLNAPGGRRMFVSDENGVQSSDIASMWKGRMDAAKTEPEKAATQAAMVAAQASRNEKEAKESSEKAYRDTLGGFKKQGPGGGAGAGGPGAPGEKSLVKDWDYIKDMAKEEGARMAPAQKAIDDSDRTIALLTGLEGKYKESGMLDTDAIDSHLRAVTGANRVPVAQLQMTTEAAGKWEHFMNLADQWVAGGKRTPEFRRQMLEAATVALEAAKRTRDRHVHAAQSTVEQRASHLGRRPEDVKKEGEGMRMKLTGEDAPGGGSGGDVTDDAYQEYRKKRGFK